MRFKKEIADKLPNDDKEMIMQHIGVSETVNGEQQTYRYHQDLKDSIKILKYLEVI